MAFRKVFICCEPLLEDLIDIDSAGISLVVAGGESAKNARRADMRWVESLLNQCKVQNVHFSGSLGEAMVKSVSLKEKVKPAI